MVWHRLAGDVRRPRHLRALSWLPPPSLAPGPVERGEDAVLTAVGLLHLTGCDRIGRTGPVQMDALLAEGVLDPTIPGCAVWRAVAADVHGASPGLGNDVRQHGDGVPVPHDETSAHRRVQRAQRSGQVLAPDRSRAQPQHGVDDEEWDYLRCVLGGRDQRGLVAQPQVTPEPHHRSGRHAATLEAL